MGRKSPKQPAKQQGRPAPREDYPVLEPYVPLAMLFWRATGAMRYPAMGGPPIGLDWVQVETLARNTGHPLPLGEWVVDTLEAMAAAACKILHEKAEREAKTGDKGKD
ncbi:hypothetical protein GCM10011317_32860 [Niveispirillum cyanobacteriorum]|nr:hypothetical protein GCM10011317_32860 [Niveispirillum cyanobacteriorum]